MNLFMKTIVKFLVFFVVISTFLSSCSILQKGDGFQGIITYDITYESDELSASDRAQLPTEMVVYISDNKVRQDQTTAFYSFSQIFDFNDGSTIILMDVMGQKIAVKQSKEEFEEAMEMAEIKEPEIKFVDETKQIAGYRSKKAELIMDGDVVDVFYTDELDVPEKINENTEFKGIKGLLMDYTVIKEGLIMTTTVREINSSRVAAHKFKIPDDYELKTAEELGGMFGM